MPALHKPQLHQVIQSLANIQTKVPGWGLITIVRRNIQLFQQVAGIPRRETPLLGYGLIDNFQFHLPHH